MAALLGRHGSCSLYKKATVLIFELDLIPVSAGKIEAGLDQITVVQPSEELIPADDYIVILKIVIVYRDGVHNNSEDDLSVEVSLQAEGLELGTAATQTVEIPAGEQVYVTWQAKVLPDAERVDLVFSAEGGGYQDASRPTLSTLEGGGIPVYLLGSLWLDMAVATLLCAPALWLAGRVRRFGSRSRVLVATMLCVLPIQVATTVRLEVARFVGDTLQYEFARSLVAIRA